jgi:hypothetical protein
VILDGKSYVSQILSRPSHVLPYFRLFPDDEFDAFGPIDNGPHIAYEMDAQKRLSGDIRPLRLSAHGGKHARTDRQRSRE